MFCVNWKEFQIQILYCKSSIYKYLAEKKSIKGHLNLLYPKEYVGLLQLSGVSFTVLVPFLAILVVLHVLGVAILAPTNQTMHFGKRLIFDVDLPAAWRYGKYCRCNNLSLGSVAIILLLTECTVAAQWCSV